MLHQKADLLRQQDAQQRGDAQESSSADRPPAGSASCEHQARDCDPFRELVQEDRHEDHDPELGADEERARNRDAVEEGVEQEPDQRRCPGDRADRVGLLAEMKVWRHRVLGEMDGEIARQHQRRRRGAASRQCRRQQFDDGHGQHEARAEGDEQLDDAQLADGAPCDRQRAKDVSGGRHKRVEQCFRHARANTPSCCAWGLPTLPRANGRASHPRRGPAAHPQRSSHPLSPRGP